MIGPTPGLDLFPLLAAALSGVACGVLGNFLVLRRLSLMGDAISHGVLPGIVVAVLVTSTYSPGAVFLGAAIAGGVTVVLVEVVRKLGRVEPGAAMGVVFSVLFAIGVLLVEVGGAHGAHIDAQCILYGQLELLWWEGAPETWTAVGLGEAIHAAPPQVGVLAGVAALSLGFVLTFFKELRIAAFDPALSTSQGFSASAMHYALMVLVAIATVASFEAVGSILVIAMLVCPAATARLLTDRLGTQVASSLVVALISSIGGYCLATIVPASFGFESVNAAGSIAVVAGAILALAIVASPRHGVWPRILRRRRLAGRIAADDTLAMLYRAEEDGQQRVPVATLTALLKPHDVTRAIAQLSRKGLISPTPAGVALTPSGRVSATELVRRHRLWEHYLVERAGTAADHVHGPAHMLEHTPPMPPPTDGNDPHGRTIPTVGHPDDPSA